MSVTMEVLFSLEFSVPWPCTVGLYTLLKMICCGSKLLPVFLYQNGPKTSKSLLPQQTIFNSVDYVQYEMWSFLMHEDIYTGKDMG